MKKNDIEKEVLTVLKKRKGLAQATAEENLNVALNDKDFKSAYLKCRELVFEIAKTEHSGKDVKSLNQELERHEKLKKSALTNIGFGTSDLEPNYLCKVCSDTGFVGLNKCECYKKEMSNQLLKYVGKDIRKLPEFSKVKYDIFDNDIKKDVQNLYEKMQEYSSALKDSNKKIIIFSGNTGVGKTYLAEMMVKNAIEHGYFTIYTTSIKLNNEFLKYYLAKLEDKEEILDSYLNADLLVIDDFGTEPILNNVTETYFYMLLNDRLSKNLSTVITTNFNDLEEIRDHYGDRIFSRLANQIDGNLINFKGKDLRVKI